MNGVMKWTTCSEIANMWAIKLEYDESLTNFKKDPKTQKTIIGPP